MVRKKATSAVRGALARQQQQQQEQQQHGLPALVAALAGLPAAASDKDEMPIVPPVVVLDGGNGGSDGDGDGDGIASKPRKRRRKLSAAPAAPPLRIVSSLSPPPAVRPTSHAPTPAAFAPGHSTTALSLRFVVLGS